MSVVCYNSIITLRYVRCDVFDCRVANAFAPELLSSHFNLRSETALEFVWGIDAVLP